MLHLLGIIAHQQKDEQTALAFMNQAIAADPSVPDYYCNRGIVLLALNCSDEAIVDFERALELLPDNPEAHFNLGKAMLSQDRYEDAIANLGRFLQRRPNSAIAYGMIGDALWKMGNTVESINACRKAVAIDPKLTTGWINLGLGLSWLGNLDEALGCYRTAMKLDPQNATIFRVLANLQSDRAELDEALENYQKAIALDPTDLLAHSAFLFAINLDPKMTPQMLRQEHAEWASRHVDPLASTIRPHFNSRDSDRRLRIGYLSPDFHGHAISYFLLPLLEAHDHSQVEVHCYSNVAETDEITARIQGFADGWHDVVKWSDEEIAEAIRSEEIDILIDMGMHTSRSRELVFARKPAPVQVVWLAYPGTTGLKTIDWRITDRFIDPPDADESWASEPPYRLPDAWCCFDHSAEFPPVNDLPAKTNGFVTFGALGAFRKINSEVLKLWSRVLNAVPESRLTLLSHEGSHRERVVALMDSLGIAQHRIQFEIPRLRYDFLKLFHQVDIGLDPFPYGGNTTTFDTMLMGVPMITWPRALATSRQTFSVLGNCGMERFAARSADDLVNLARDVASDLPRLAELRSALRDHLHASPAMDGPRFARNMEAAYREMWHHWCSRGK